MEVMHTHPAISQSSSISSLLRYPVRKIWLDVKPYLATIGNLDQQCGGDDHRHRKKHLLKLKDFHAFTSPQDSVLEPYQSGVFGHYAEVADSADLLAMFKTLAIVDMKHTVEDKKDTYGLRTLDKCGELVRHVVDHVPHVCWIQDVGDCSVHKTLEIYLGPILH